MKCVACRGDQPKLSNDQISALPPAVQDWQVIEVDGVNRLERTFKFKDFIEF